MMVPSLPIAMMIFLEPPVFVPSLTVLALNMLAYEATLPRTENTPTGDKPRPDCPNPDECHSREVAWVAATAPNQHQQEQSMSKFIPFLILAFLVGCTDADVASRNLSKAAEYFELDRRVVFYNGITGEYMLTIEGRCSVESMHSVLAVTCRTGHDEFKKHYLGLSDNVTYFSEQVKAAVADVYHYRIVFKPSVIIPDVELAD